MRNVYIPPLELTLTNGHSMKASCNYLWDEHGQQVDARLSTMNFLLFHIPVAPNQMWLPGTFQSLRPYRREIRDRGLSIDQFFGGIVMTTMVEQEQTLAGALRRYFGHIHPWLSVIHEHTFRERASELGNAPKAEIALIFLVMLLVLKGSQMAGSCNQLYSVCRYLFSFIQNSHGPSVGLVQAGLLLAVFELGSGLHYAASLRIGTCARLGYILQLNIQTMPTQQTSLIEAEESRRLWLGVYMVDRLIHQMEDNSRIPHTVEELPVDFPLPLNDQEWQAHVEGIDHAFFQPTFSTPLHVPLCYFARELQAIRILGEVQALSRISNPQTLKQQVETLDSMLMQFMEQLFQQTPGDRDVLCGANATALLAAIILHKTQLTAESPDTLPLPSTPAIHRSVIALHTLIKMVRDICIKYTAGHGSREISFVPLPSLICTGEAALAAVYVNQSFPGSNLEIAPLRAVLGYAAWRWGLAEDYLRQLGQGH
ncbi:hypothetical protein BJY04DRAFT_212834 [Aspergillus karnatakaensis]|uniref:fungal specific transcription factor domain-containing protein n=1 Tax=Aspergillus karnatakaensis TaxID=1810916 RepID=UPI003CCD9B99